MNFDFKSKLDHNGKLIQEVNTELVVTKSVGQTPVSQVLPLMKLVATEYGLNLSTQRGFKIASGFLKNSSKNN